MENLQLTQMPYAKAAKLDQGYLFCCFCMVSPKYTRTGINTRVKKTNLIKTWGTYCCTHPLRVKP